MITRQRGFRSRSKTRQESDSKENDNNSSTSNASNNNTSTITKIRLRGRSISNATKNTARSRSNSTTRSNKTTSSSRSEKVFVSKNSQSNPNNMPTSRNKSKKDSSLRGGDVVMLGHNMRVPLKRTFSASTTSSTGATSTKSSIANESSKEIENSRSVPQRVGGCGGPAAVGGPAGGHERLATDKEVDFFTNPTVLSRLIHNQKFAAAIARLERQGPAEASVWVCTKQNLPNPAAALASAELRPSNNEGVDAISSATASLKSSKQGGSPSTKNAGNTKVNVGDGKDASNNSSSGSNGSDRSYGEFTFRQLPIHMASGSLFRVEDPNLRQDLEQLIARLVIAYPDGCARRDHQGRYPLHECIWYNAEPRIISALLMAAPEIACVGDLQGVTPVVLNEHRNCSNPLHKKMVHGMLKKSPDFWRAARKEAEYRMKHRNIPAADATISSTSVLASSVVEEETIASVSGDMKHLQRQQRFRQKLQEQLQQQQQQGSNSPQRPSDSPPPVSPIADVKPLEWLQLEKKASALKQKLSECYEHVYALNQQLNETKGAKNALQIKLDKFVNSDLGKQVVALENERDELQFHLARSKALLAKHGISLEEENLAEGMPPLPPLHLSIVMETTSRTTTTTTEPTTQENRAPIRASSEEGEDLSADNHRLEQKKMAVMKDLKNQDPAQQQERLEYYSQVFENCDDDDEYEEVEVEEDEREDATLQSEITSDYTTMTPASRFHPKRPEPE